MPGNFSFVIPGKLAGSAKPGLWTDLRSDLAGLSRQGIGALVSLAEDKIDRAALRDVGFVSLHLPIEDFFPPRQEQIDIFVEFVDARLNEGVAVVVHCGAGIGRTGTMIACYLVFQGMPADAAIAKVRDARPGSIETDEQKQSIYDYHRRLKSTGNERGQVERGHHG